MSAGSHVALVREAFTRQAAAYAANPVIADPERLGRLVRLVDPAPTARVLDVACGPGYVALAFAEVCGSVVGVDATPAQLASAERLRAERGVTNARFREADAQRLPFEAGAFDVVVCRFALHHVPDPSAILAEMVRVCRPGGTVAVEDLVASEHPARAAYQDRVERLRDPSHTRALPLSHLLGLLAGAGLEVDRVQTGSLVQDAERWLANAATPAEQASQVRALLAADVAEDLSGLRPAWQDGRLTFTQRTAALAARVLGVAGGADTVAKETARA